jgi:hypothetical protein
MRDEVGGFLVPKVLLRNAVLKLQLQFPIFFR